MQKVDAAEEVASQLQAFKVVMEKDLAVQRRRVLTIINSAVKRGERLIDETLRFQNTNTFSIYLREAADDLTGKKVKTSPLVVADAFGKQVINLN